MIFYIIRADHKKSRDGKDGENLIATRGVD